MSFTLAPALTARLAALCRRSCGVIVGKLSSDFWHLATAGAKNRFRQLDTRNTSPPGVVNTKASRPLPTINAAKSSASAAGNGTERRSWVFGVDQTKPLYS